MTELGARWSAALAKVVVRHPNRESRVIVRVSEGDPPVLHLALDATRCTADPDRIRAPFTISDVTLTYFPGEQLAQTWLAAAWAGYLQHEALELVTLGDDLNARVIDPHAPPYTFDRGLRQGLPVVLTEDTLFQTLIAVMPRSAARALVVARG